MQGVAESLAEIEDRIVAACARSGRCRSEVELIAVSKTFPAEVVREAWDCGHRVFGESRWQEAESKIAALPKEARWHFIGGVQRNKVRKILPHVEAVHAIDSFRLASYADQVAAELGLSPQIFLQVNVGGEASKGGFSPDQLAVEIESLMGLKRLRILGLMTIPPAEEEAELARPWFVQLRELRDDLERRIGAKLPHLSMGMSGDYEVAIEEGATWVRVGSAIFGRRAYRVDGELG